MGLRPRNPRMVFPAKIKNLRAAFVAFVQDVVAFSCQPFAIFNRAAIQFPSRLGHFVELYLDGADFVPYPYFHLSFSRQ